MSMGRSMKTACSNAIHRSNEHDDGSCQAVKRLRPDARRSRKTTDENERADDEGQEYEGHDPTLARIAEIVHDIDLKDDKFGHPETPGIERLIAGIAMSHKDDETRLSRAAAMLDDLYGYFSRKRG